MKPNPGLVTFDSESSNRVIHFYLYEHENASAVYKIIQLHICFNVFIMQYWNVYFDSNKTFFY